MKIIIKGGVWKNTEDEILKAAVMKYGKNQWARISSLLTRKTPKQCKARWYEWIDPSIKKTEWSKEEDEKLLHLAKLMPTQWRTIAPIVGRTAAQCLERYQRLLDEAELGGDGITSDDVRKLRPGEIDPDPETKPARPDPVDMDEDEKEMLSEARARLANTQGKKAKRKARERQILDARRISQLEKRREMKAAGIDMKLTREYEGVDYNADIPFHKPQPAGFWDTTEETYAEKRLQENKANDFLTKLDGKRKIQVNDEEEKKEPAKKLKREFKMPEPVPIQRSKLNLPAPQLSEKELQEIEKIGSVTQLTREMVEDESVNFLGEYNVAPTPMRPTTNDSIRDQAKSLRAMAQSQTPLLGGSIDLPVQAKSTSRSFIKNTPLRDELGINTPLITQDESIKYQPKLSLLFKNLSKPKNDFEIILPQVSKTQKEEIVITPDAQDLLDQKEQERLHSKQLQLAKETQVIQRKLDRSIVSPEMLTPHGKGVDLLICQEKILLLQSDATRFPLKGQPILPNVQLPTVSLDYLNEATELIRAESKPTEMHPCAKVTPIQKDFDIYKSKMKELGLSGQKQEQEIGLSVGSWIGRSQSLLTVWNESLEQLTQKRLELNTFQQIQAIEAYNSEQRLSRAQKELQTFSFMEQDLQDQFRSTL